MKIIDIRNTQSGWVADVLLNEKSMLPISIPVAEVGYSALEDFADSDPAHIRTADPRTPEQRAMDEDAAEVEETQFGTREWYEKIRPIAF